MGLKSVFKRREYKYLLSARDYQLLRKELEPYMTEDQYGQTTIMSLYFDTPQYYFINQSIKKVTYKSKFRVRSYGVPTASDPVFLEQKKKIQGIVYKRRLTIPYQELVPTLTSKFSNEICENLTPNARQIKNEIKWDFDHYELQPMVLIANERSALKTTFDSDFRVTFDSKIRFRDAQLKFTQGTDGTPIDTDFDYIMEVKATGAYPLWFTEILAKLHLVKGRFSKYGYVYQYYLSRKENVNV